MSKLSSQFLKIPRYSLKVSLKGGRALHLADPRATRALLCLMNMQAVMGGAAAHWGGPSAFAELASALTALVFSRSKNWFDDFHIINDAGHCENGLYALKANYEYAGITVKDLKGFRSVSSILTGHGEAHLFPEGVYLSNGPLGSTLAQAQGLSLADRLREKNRTTVVMTSDGALMEGEAKEALASIPGLAVKGKMNPFLLIISDNNKKLSGPIDVESFSMSGTLSSLSTLGWKTIVLDSPHDLEKTLHGVNTALEESLKDRLRPVALQAKTIKGYGLKETKNSLSGGHGFPLKTPEKLTAFLSEIYQGEKVPDEFLAWSEELMNNFLSSKKTLPNKNQKSIKDNFKKKNIFNLQFSNPKEFNLKAVCFVNEEKKEKTQAGISKALIKKFEQGFPLVSVSSDLWGSTGVAAFRKKFPKFSFDMGVSEANMISTAAGLSKQGFIPVVDTFAQFGVSKGILPLFMAGLSQAPVIAVFSHIGFQDAADGASHQCLTYFAQTGSLPHTKIYSLSSAEEALALMEQAVESFHKEKKNIIFFLGREKFHTSYLEPGYKYQIGRAQVVFSNFSAPPDSAVPSKKTCTLAVSGTLLEEALKAARALDKEGWRVIVVHPSCINEPDLAVIGSCISQTQGNILTIEDHQVKGGMASFLSHALAVHQIPFCMRSLGAEGVFGRSAYKAIDLYGLHGLDSYSIASAVKFYFC